MMQSRAGKEAERLSGQRVDGWVRQHARKRVFKLSLPRKMRPWMDAIFRQIEIHPPPFAYSSESSGFNHARFLVLSLSVSTLPARAQESLEGALAVA
jgi:hypothetical protein